MVETNESEFLYNELIEPYLSDYIGKNVFEDICKEYLRIQNSKRTLPFVFSKIGRWWGTDPKKKAPVEIDFLPIMIQKSSLENANGGIFVFFSKSGFTKSAMEDAKIKKDVILVDLETLSNT